MSARRAARLRAPAKINLDLRVLGRRPDGFHELRTIFHTISLADRIDIEFTPSRGVSVELDDPQGIPDNLVVRAARLVLEAAGATGAVRIRLDKRIPMGAGLGGGSSDAAAVLLALPVLAGRRVPLARLCELGQDLGSDVPFFLMGGAAAAIGRGTELFPLSELHFPARHGLLVTPALHVSTAEAYAALSPGLTTESQQNKIFSFQALLWGNEMCPQNDFESVVFEKFGRIAALKQKLVDAGAAIALMTGSGSAVFGLFPARNAVSGARESLGGEMTFRISLVSRARYRSLWWRALEEHITGRVWPPQSRYTR
jgi:4-diphosphocytidyl-2-C-methyl-D-erythritol kinase